MVSSATDVIARMVVGVEGDNSGLTRTLGDSTRDVTKFGRHVQVTADQMQRALKLAGGDLAKAARFAAGLSPAGGDGGSSDPTAGLKRILDARSRMIESAAKREARILADAIAANDPFVNAIGLKQGQSLARAMSTGFAQGNAVTNIRRALAVQTPVAASPAATGGVLGGGRAQAALLGVLFTLTNMGEQLAAVDTKWNKLERTVSTSLKTIGLFAASFGPEGIIVSAVTLGLSFVFDFFSETSQQAQRAAKEAEDRMKEAINTGQQLQRIRALEFGEPGAGIGKNRPDVFADSIKDLQAQFDKLKAVRDSLLAQRAGNLNNPALALGIDKLIAANLRELKSVREQLLPLEEERKRLVQSLLTPVTVPEIRGARPIDVKAPAPGFESAELQRQAEKILSVYKSLSDAGQPVVDAATRLVAVYFELGDALDSIKNPWDDQAVAVRNLRIELEKTIPLLAGITGAIPPIGTINGPPKIPRTPTFTPPVAPKLPDVQVGFLDRILTNIKPIFASIGTAITTTLQQTLVSAFGPVALLLRALEPALKVLEPLLNSFVAPLAAVVQVIAAALEPAFRLLFPIVRAVAVVLAFFAEMVERITAVIARIVGNVVGAIGKTIRGLTFGLFGKGISNAGDSILRFADGAKRSADQILRTRKQLESMNFGDTADSITGLGDAARRATEELLNVPVGYRVALDRFLATTPVSNRGSTSTVPRPVAEGQSSPTYVFGPGSVVVNAKDKSSSQIFKEVSAEARELSVRKYGTTSRAGEVFALPG